MESEVRDNGIWPSYLLVHVHLVRDLVGSLRRWVGTRIAVVLGMVAGRVHQTEVRKDDRGG